MTIGLVKLIPLVVTLWLVQRTWGTAALLWVLGALLGLAGTVLLFRAVLAVFGPPGLLGTLVVIGVAARIAHTRSWTYEQIGREMLPW